MSKYRGGGIGGSSHARENINAVFYADTYHPIQAGSIDGTDILPHDNGIYRALLCSSAGLYDPNGDPKTIGDPYCTIFVGRLSPYTTEDSLLKAMSRYGRVKNLRLVRHIVTGASRGYAFVDYETEREMRHAYEDAHHTIIDDSEIIVDFNRQKLMPGWIPRRLGGGLGGRKESGQLRFGGRERPFRAPLRPIPRDDLKRLGIPLPPEGHYKSRVQVPLLPRRRSPVKDHKSAVSDVGGRTAFGSLEEPEKRYADEQFEHRKDSESSRRNKRKTSRESHYGEHMHSSDEDKSRHKHGRKNKSIHDHQRQRESSPLGHNFAVAEMTEHSSYHVSDSTQKGSADEYVGHRRYEHSEKRGRTTGKVDSTYYGNDEDDGHRHRHGPKSSHDHKEKKTFP